MSAEFESIRLNLRHAYGGWYISVDSHEHPATAKDALRLAKRASPEHVERVRAQIRLDADSAEKEAARQKIRAVSAVESEARRTVELEHRALERRQEAEALAP